MSLINVVYIAVGALVLGSAVTFLYFYLRDKWFMSITKQEANRLLEQARSERERIEKESKINVKEEMLKLKIELEKEAREKTKDLQSWEKRLLSKEENIDKRISLVDAKEEKIKKSEEELLARENKVKNEMELYRNKVNEAQKKLETLTGMTTEEAKKVQVEMIIEDAKHESAKSIKQIEDEAREEAEKRAKYVIATAIQRYSGEYVAERTISTVNLPSEEMKGRIIGREGRNIRAIEAATGVDLIVDDTPETVVISSFDPFRREVARLSIERLISDGRIHPGRIEEVVEKATVELDKVVKEAGEQAMFETGVHGIHTELLKLIGSLKFRTSYSQNQYVHAMEVTFLASAMAGELGVDPKLAKRAALLHDIGKAIDHSADGSHAQIGADMARKYGEKPDVVQAIRAHHEEVPPESILDFIVQAADALSGARPGARREMLESYIQRVDDLEKLASSFPGVEKCFAIQAGREIRVMVKSDQISDENAVVLSRDIAKKVEDDLSYPGQVKVTVIRETRAVGVAK